MKFQMNFTTSQDDVQRYSSAEDLRGFYRKYGLDGLEVMPLPCGKTGGGQHRIPVRFWNGIW